MEFVLFEVATGEKIVNADSPLQMEFSQCLVIPRLFLVSYFAFLFLGILPRKAVARWKKNPSLPWDTINHSGMSQ